MSTSFGIGLLLTQRRLAAASAVTLIGFTSNLSGNPTPAAHIAGDLLIVSADTGSSTTLPTADAGWTAWGAGASGNGCAQQFFHRIATASGTTITLTGATGLRACWVFRGGAIDQIAYLNAANSVNFTIPELASISADSFVGVRVSPRAAQTDLATAVNTPSTGLTQRNAGTTRWLGDSDTVRHSTWAALARTFDTTSSGHNTVSFSIKPA